MNLAQYTRIFCNGSGLRIHISLSVYGNVCTFSIKCFDRIKFFAKLVNQLLVN